VRPSLECVGGFLVFMLIVVDVAEIVVQVPISRVISNPIFDQLCCMLRISRAIWRPSREKGPAKLVHGNQVWIKLAGDVQQRPKHVVSAATNVVFATVILHRSGPINVREEAVVSQAQALQKLRRRDVENFFQSRLRPYAIYSVQY